MFVCLLLRKFFHLPLQPLGRQLEARRDVAFVLVVAILLDARPTLLVQAFTLLD